MAQWHNVLRDVGLAVLPIAIKAMSALASILENIAQFGQEFPGLFKGLTLLIGSIAALTAVGGVVTLATAGFKALGLAMAASKMVNVAGSLTNVIPGLTMIGTLAKGLGGVAVAGTVGYMLGEMINSFGPGGDLGGFLGGKFYEWVHGDANADSSPGGLHQGWDRGLVSRGNRPINVTTHLSVDGVKFASVLTKHMADDFAKPQTGVNDFDWRIAMLPAGGVSGL
jgi:hypothetical protein